MRNHHRIGLRPLKIILLMTAAMAPLPAFAQSDPGQTPPAESEGEVAGRLQATIEVDTTYVDNIFATRRDEVEDLIVAVRPGVSWMRGSGDRRFSAYARGELGRYADNDSEDYDDWSLGADGRYAVSPGTILIGGADYQWRHESRTSPEDVRGLGPTEYEQSYLYGGLLLRWESLAARVAASLTGYDFSDVATSSGVINNDDRDRTQAEIGVRLGWVRSPAEEWFAQASLDSRDYDAALDDFGFARDSDGLSLGLGVRRASPTLSAEAFAGVMRRSYDDPALGDVTALDFGALVDWTGPSGLGLGLRLDRSLEETTLPGSPAYILTSGALNLTATPHPSLQVGAGMDAAHYDYQNSTRSETSIGLRSWVRYWVDPRVFVGLEHGISQRASTAAGFDYDENRLMLRVGAQLRPHYSAEAGDLDLSQTAPGGAYVGVLAGYGVLSTGLDGPRGPGSNTADFGDMGASYGLVAGYGWTSGPIYLGLEAEAFGEGPEWRHHADRDFGVHKESAFGLSGRLGWVSGADDLIYVRAGAYSGSFHDSYVHASNVVDDSASRTGMGGGVGIEAGTGGRGFVRAEYLVTSWEDYEVATGGGNSDNFSHSESQFRLGGGLRFGAPAPRADRATADFSGPYVGVRFGHGAVLSDNEGVRSGGTAIDIIRASHGPVLGVVAGYGVTFGRAYVGLEFGADSAEMNWNIERDPNGRIYSTERGGSVSVAARLGWRIGESAMVYGQIGAVRARFDIPYQTSGVAVHSDESVSGLRAGAGLEVALGEETWLRLDYATTEYDRYDVEYSTNSDSFDHAESLASIVLIWRPAS